ncbi:unnamed protein product, partial [Mesorhabditis spiculigera]
MYIRGLFVLCLAAAVAVANLQQDPYATLGLKKGASIRDIKKAYKSQAREWHPDKNDSPEAGEKFMAISKAYEVLSDPIKKDRYDKYGAFDDTPQGHNDFHGFGGYNSFFGGFGQTDRQNSFFAKHKISMRLYSHSILEKSNQQPFILFAYSGYCHLCYQIEPVWQSVVEDLEPLGYGVGTINAMTDGNLLEKLRVTHLPSLMVLVEGRVIHYSGNMVHMNAKNVRVWARDVIPRSVLITIDAHETLKRFIDQWKTTNKVSVLILGAAAEPRLRYILTAMKYSQTARFAYIHLGGSNPEVQDMREALAIKCTQCENVLIFNDAPERGPIARLSISNANQLTKDMLTQILDQNRFMTLPRLSSNIYLDELCPVSSRNPRRLCAILVVMDGSDEKYVESYRRFVTARKGKFDDGKVNLVYLYANRQTDWIKPFLERRSGNPDNSARDVLVMWRYEHVKARFTWLNGAWKEDGSEATLDAALTDVLRNSIKLDEMANVGNLNDEYYPSWWNRMSKTVVRLFETLWFHSTKEEALPVLSVVGTLFFIFFAYYALNYLTRPETRERRRFSPTSSEEWHPEDPNVTDKDALHTGGPKDSAARNKKIMSVMEPIIHELRAESYYGMVRLLKPGCRSMILLVDEEHKKAVARAVCQVFVPASK